MMKKFISFLFCFLICLAVTQAQNVLQGTVTNMSNGEKTAIKFTRTFTQKDNVYSTDYKLTDTKGIAVAVLKVAYNKPTGKINIRVTSKKDTTVYEFTYADSLGGLFGLHGTYLKEPVNKYEVVLSFLTANKTYLKVNQVTDKNKTTQTHYQLERVLRDDLTLNEAFLKKLKNQPSGTGNIVQQLHTDTGKKNTPVIPVQPDAVKQTPPPVTVTVKPVPETRQLPSPTQPVSPSVTYTKTKSIGSDVKYWSLDSLRVILKPTQNQIVSIKLFIQGGTSNYTLVKEGIEGLALQWVINSGTKTMSTDSIAYLLAQSETTINYTCGLDYSVISMTCTKEYFDESWQVLSDIILHPAFNADDFTAAREQVLNEIQSEESDPFTFMMRNAMNLLFIGKYYDRNPMGSAYSVNRLSAEEVKKYFLSLINKRRCTLVAAGNIDSDDLNLKIKTLIKSLPSGTVTQVPDNPMDVTASTFKMQETESSENYILGIAGAPSAGSREEALLQLAFALINNRLDTEVKDKKNLSDDVLLKVQCLRQNFSILTLTTSNPDKAIQTIIDEIKKVRKSGFTTDEVRRGKDNFLTQYFLLQESNDEIAGSLGEKEMDSGWESAENYYDVVNGFSVAELNAVVRKYLRGFKFYFYGSKDAANEIIFTQRIE